MTASQRSGGGLSSSARGLLVLAAAVLLGAVLLLKADPGKVGTARINANADVTTTTATPDGSGATTSTTTATTSSTSSSVPVVTRPAGEVKVLVLNGTGGIAKVAGATADKIKGAGYDSLIPNNTASRPTTAVYFTNDYLADAKAVATLLNLPTSAVQPLSDPPPAPNVAGANVVVVLGKDTPPAP